MEGAVVAPLAASEVGVAAISAGAALLGAAVGEFATYRVERSRQDHERVLEQQRYDREEATRGREELNFARGVARVLRDDLDRAWPMSSQRNGLVGGYRSGRPPNSVDLSDVEGIGADGRITVHDIKRVAPEQ